MITVWYGWKGDKKETLDGHTNPNSNNLNFLARNECKCTGNKQILSKDSLNV